MPNIFHEFILQISGVANDTAISRTALWTAGLFVATILLWWIAKGQLSGINKTTKADFIKKFTDDFFNETTREIIMLFDYKALNFRSSEIEYGKDISTKPFPYFMIDENIVKQLKIDLKKRKGILDKECYSSFEIDDCLLGFFEDLGSYEKKGLIDIEGVYDGFDWYIDIIWNNCEIKNYARSQADDEKDGDDIYENFKYIYEKCDSYGKAKLAGQWIWWWKIKWWIDKIFFKI